MNTSKIIFVGDAGSGKTSIIRKKISNTFDLITSSTIGGEFKSIRVRVEKDTDVTLHLWDTAGQERYRSLISLYYRNAHAILFIFDLTSIESLHNIKKWIDDYKTKYFEPKTVLFLVGNKYDLLDNNTKQNKEYIQMLIDTYGLIYYDASAKSGHNIEQLFLDIAKRARVIKKINDKVNIIKISNADDIKPLLWGCCSY